MAEENQAPAPRGLTLEQAHFTNFQCQPVDLIERLGQVTAELERLALPQAPQVPRAPPVLRREAPLVRAMIDEEEEEELLEEVGPPSLQQQPRRVDHNIKLKIPSFEGTSDPEMYLEWVQRVEKIFEYYDYTDAQKCKLAALEFTDYANLWWENVKAQRRRDGLA